MTKDFTSGKLHSWAQLLDSRKMFSKWSQRVCQPLECVLSLWEDTVHLLPQDCRLKQPSSIRYPQISWGSWWCCSEGCWPGRGRKLWLIVEHAGTLMGLGGPWRNRHPINSICAEQYARPAWPGSLWWNVNTQIWKRASELITNTAPPRADVKNKVNRMCWERNSHQTSKTMATHACCWRGEHCNPQLLETWRKPLCSLWKLSHWKGRACSDRS